MIGSRIGPYDVIAKIGEGGIGEVYRARDTRLKRDVALKILPDVFASDPDRLARFEREAEVLASLNHPHIAQIYGLEVAGSAESLAEQDQAGTSDAGAPAGRPEGRGSRILGGPPSLVRALVMELVEGPTLADRIAQGPIPVREALRIATQIADALDAAHERGIVHRDLKPANVKVRPDGTVKVLDFGLAKALESRAGTASAHAASLSPTITSPAATLHGVLLGTAAYMSPEQARGEPVDRRADIWAFGVVLHEMLTGRRLFEGKTISDTLAAVLMKDPDIGDAPAETRKLLSACLERDLKRRLRDIGEVWRFLEAESRTAAPRARAPLIAWSLVALLALAAAGAGWVAWQSVDRSERPLVRLDVDLGADVNLMQAPNNDIALSPDGRHLAYVDASRAGGGRIDIARGRNAPMMAATRVMLRRLDRATAIELPGTDGATTVFFSPDSQWLGFSGIRGLNRSSVEGGAAVGVADIVGYQGAFWGNDNTMFVGGRLRTATRDAALWRIPPSGGDPVRVVDLPETTGQMAQILPGGRHALTVDFGTVPGLMGRLWDTATIQGVSLTDGARKTIARGVSPMYLTTGHLIYVSGGTLFGVRFDPEALETRGAAAPLLDDVRFNAVNGRAALSVSRDGTLVYRRGGESGLPVGEARFEWITAGSRSPMGGPPRNFDRPRFSPDGTRLAVIISEPDNRDEWVLDLGRENLTRLTFGDFAVTTSAWSRDGRFLMFGTGSGAGGIYSVRADGSSPPERLLEVDGLVFLGSYSPELQRLAYFVSTGRGSTIFTVPISEEAGRLKAGTSEPFLQSVFQNGRPEFSLDGRWMAYASNESGRFEVHVRPFPPSDAGSRVVVSTDGGDHPRWTRAGNELLYESGDRIMSVRYTVRGDTFVPERPRVRAEKLTGPPGAWDVARRTDRGGDARRGPRAAASPAHGDVRAELRRRAAAAAAGRRVRPQCGIV